MYKQNLVKWNIRKNVFGVASITLFDTTYDPIVGFTQMGLYQGPKKGISLWNNKHYKVPCEIKTFINTLLHEFMHHYDYYYLRLPDSVHCKGFEARIRDLRKKLAS